MGPLIALAFTHAIKPFSWDYERSIDDSIDLIRSRSLMILEWVHEVYEGADHMDVPIRSLPDVLDFLFPEFSKTSDRARSALGNRFNVGSRIIK